MTSKARLAFAIAWVKDVQRAVAFYETVFGLKAEVRDQGFFTWSQFDTGGTILAFAGEEEAQSFFPGAFNANAPSAPVNAQCFSFAVDDCAATYAAAVANGAEGLRPPTPQPWGAIWAQARDPNGVLISIIQMPTA